MSGTELNISKVSSLLTIAYFNYNKCASIVGYNNQWKKTCKNKSIRENKRNTNKKVITALHVLKAFVTRRMKDTAGRDTEGPSSRSRPIVI